MLIQYLLVLIFLYGLVRSITRFRHKEFSKTNLVVWIILWLVGIVVVLIPDVTFSIARVFGVGRGADLVVYLSLAVLFLVVFRLVSKTEKMERDITKLTRKIALEKVTKK
ncbi:MAG TPA: DUF2304 family protein [Patescibacteria group bacterium]|nr:DUF2304 family protein [Patescibacteria group bacterium]